MRYKVHRGSHEIGGNCIELISRGKSLLLDIGTPLSDVNPDISYVHGKYDAVIISHSHADHYGLMNMIDKNIPIYIGELSFQLIEALSYFTNYEIPENKFILFKPWKDFIIEGTNFTIHPFLMDHSSPEAFAFLISDDEEKLFYTGDFRATGAKKIVLENLEKHPPKDVKKLIIEGTNLNRQAGNYITEDDIKLAFQKIFITQTNISFVIGSSQNIDRIICAYKAARDAKKTLVMDFYTYWILNLVSQKSDAIKAVLPDIMVLRKGSISGSQYNKMMMHKEIFDEFARTIFRNNQTLTEEDLINNPAAFVFYGRLTHFSLIKKFQLHDLNLIYSQWNGYLTDRVKKNPYGADEINTLKTQTNFIEIHTSGHAYKDDLQRMEAIFPGAELIRVHTEF